MAHSISGIITSFKYSGDLPNIILVGNFHFIPIDLTQSPAFREQALAPYDSLNVKAKKQLKDLSFSGKCAYVETDFFGTGSQLAEYWEDGKNIEGPYYSSHGLNDPTIPDGVVITEKAINLVLEKIGVFRHEGKDEFDSLRLGDYRFNSEMVEEYNRNQFESLK